MNIKFDHINLTVANLKDSMDWYGKIFGFRPVESGTTPLGVMWAIVAADDSMICMSEYPGKTPADKFDDESIHQIYHFGVRVSDVDHWQKTVKDNKLKLYYGGAIEYPYSTSWYIHDPSGHEIEVSYAGGEKLRFPDGGGL